jgi:hypothetical protein
MEDVLVLSEKKHQGGTKNGDSKHKSGYRRGLEDL